jgi:hypothetical protein
MKPGRDHEQLKSIEDLRFTIPGELGLILRFSRDRAPTAEELMHQYLAAIGRKGGLATKGISTPAKRHASRANGLKGGRPRKVKG